MERHGPFEIELAALKRALAGMGGIAETMLEQAVTAILAPNEEAHERIHDLECRVDDLEIEIEEQCHRLIALRAPLARDLRFLISSTRIAMQVEQIADLARALAKRARFIARHRRVRNPPRLAELASVARGMVRQAMDAFISGDPTAIDGVFMAEPDADELARRCFEVIQDEMANDPSRMAEHTHLLRAVGHLEHIGDITVSMAREALFIRSGRMTRPTAVEGAAG
jgi:phosphate transport system protein